MHLRWRLSRSDACRVWAETQRAHTHTHSHSLRTNVQSPCCLNFSSFHISTYTAPPHPPHLLLLISSHTATLRGVFHLWPWPMSYLPTHSNTHTHTQTHRHTLWWSLVGQLEAAVFIVERMYRVVGSNHWLPFYPLGVCIPFWLSGPC